MTHPLKKISVVELQTALADALQSLTGKKCSVHVGDIDFHEQTVEQALPKAFTSLRIEFDLDYGVTGDF